MLGAGRRPTGQARPTTLNGASTLLPSVESRPASDMPQRARTYAENCCERPTPTWTRLRCKSLTEGPR
eukprot:14137887-Alexandrium_andersonii.AAC.1